VKKNKYTKTLLFMPLPMKIESCMIENESTQEIWPNFSDRWSTNVNFLWVGAQIIGQGESSIP